MKWVNKLKVEGCTITVIGKDLHDFNRAVRSWSRVPSTLRVLIVVNCPSWATTKLLRELHSLGESLSMPYIWTVESNVPPTDNATRHNPNAQACVMFTSRNTSIELDPAWFEKVLEEPTPWLERSPDSHHNLRGIVEVLRRHGEEGKFLLSLRKPTSVYPWNSFPSLTRERQHQDIMQGLSLALGNPSWNPRPFRTLLLNLRLILVRAGFDEEQGMRHVTFSKPRLRV
ncbi:hypothetical protein BKA61DRAFT_607062 [Leptodontidium sp. MPI-SDFR-AT-0119]|nr:hypothetical protein BKA61DRAFT_607062 [Leptodontidium sp. MPI-SDFR-AT-0119]